MLRIQPSYSLLFFCINKHHLFSLPTGPTVLSQWEKGSKWGRGRAQHPAAALPHPSGRAGQVLPAGCPHSPKVRWRVMVIFFRRNQRQGLTRDWEQGQNVGLRSSSEAGPEQGAQGWKSMLRLTTAAEACPGTQALRLQLPQTSWNTAVKAGPVFAPCEALLQRVQWKCCSPHPASYLSIYAHF